ncbi:ester cyclase [Lederbergia sp. NSJ-179]|uniref:ester cyclase n=1 Tax=Lederbergia sp. NSJ-179 TaxID=2931402 RepID=UPI001FD28441|nr:ester cyclase [Lederbergia sp. NSJ-179]MCJ7841614.1 ester cyclase [Lederbergia sp. NSJ-179]
MVVYNKKQIYALWLQAWNEDISLIDNITAADCTVHYVRRMDGKSLGDLYGGEALKEVIKDCYTFFNDVNLSAEMEPIINGPYVLARWNFTGVYKGGIAEAKVKAGEKIRLKGMDLFLIKNGKIKNYWFSWDRAQLIEQLDLL